MALQANVLSSDQSPVGKSFENIFNKMVSNLKTLFTIPDLSRNMRNSQNINKVSQSVKEVSFISKVNNTIKKLPPPTTSSSNEEPILIPVHANDFESNFQSILNEAILNPKKKTLILHNNNFTERELKSLFL